MTAPSGDEVSWLVELTVKLGVRDEFGRLTAEMVISASHEPGVIAYERYVEAAEQDDQDEQTAIGYERYLDPAAALAHLEEFERTFSARFTPMVDRVQVLVMGDVTPELRGKLDSIGARYFSSLDGFA